MGCCTACYTTKIYSSKISLKQSQLTLVYKPRQQIDAVEFVRCLETNCKRSRGAATKRRRRVSGTHRRRSRRRQLLSSRRSRLALSSTSHLIPGADRLMCRFMASLHDLFGSLTYCRHASTSTTSWHPSSGVVAGGE